MRAVEITKTYLKECVVHHRLDESKNTHLEHLEDLIFNDGLKGGKEAINYLVSFFRHPFVPFSIFRKSLSIQFLNLRHSIEAINL